MKKKVNIISSRIKEVESLTKYSNYIGKKVFSKSGDFVGKIKDIFTKHNTMIAVLISGKQKIIIDKENFSSDSEDAVMLSINPVICIIGKKVFDADGRKMGHVVDIDRRTYENDFLGIIIKKGLFRKPIMIPKKEIDILRKNIILKSEYE